MKAVDGLKKCSKCWEVKWVEEYGKVSASPDGYRSCCKKCFKASVNVEKRKLSQSKYRKSEKGNKYVSNIEYLDKLKILRATDEYKLKRRAYQKSSAAKVTAKAAQNRNTSLLKNSYLKSTLELQYSVPYKEITEEMIEVKRLQLTNKRFIKKLKLCKTSKI